MSVHPSSRRCTPRPASLHEHPTPRFSSTPKLTDSVLSRLSGVCSELIRGGNELAEAGRDWWPIAVTWAAHGQVPALPEAVAVPTDPEQVAAVLAICAEAGVPVTTSGGRSGVCGGAVPVFGGLVLDMTALSGLTDVDDASLVIDVLPGMIGTELEAQLRSEHGLTLGHWPQSMALSSVGGWLACRSAGQYSTRYGKIEDMATGLEVALSSGEVIKLGGRGPRAATGPDLAQLFIGSEGTLGVITSARLRVHPLPNAQEISAWGFDTFSAGLEVCRRILRRGATPAVLRLYDATESAFNFGVQKNLLIVLDEADAEIVPSTANIVAAECSAEGAERLDDALVTKWVEKRDHVASLEALAAEGIVADTIEIAANWAVLPDIYTKAVNALQSIDSMIVGSGHQSHAYPDGACIYFTFAGQPPVEQEEIFYNAAWQAVMDATLEAGGAISHHHGIGMHRARYFEEASGNSMATLQSLKDALDPRGVLNPGKLGLRGPFGTPPWP